MCRAPVSDITSRCPNYNQPMAHGFSTTEIYDPNYDGIQDGYYNGYVASYNRDYDVINGYDYYEIIGDEVCDQYDYDSPNIPSYCRGYMDGRRDAHDGYPDDIFIGNDDLRGQEQGQGYDQGYDDQYTGLPYIYGQNEYPNDDVWDSDMEFGFGKNISDIKYLKKLIK